MTFLIVFFAVILLTWLSPYVILLISTDKIKIKSGNYKCYVICSHIPMYAMACGFFNAHIFINVAFAGMLSENEKEILRAHEKGHIIMGHPEKKAIIAAIKLAVIAQLLVIIAPWYIAVIIICIAWGVNALFDNAFRKLFWDYEYKADRFAAFETEFTARILLLYEKFARNKYSATHPSVNHRIEALGKWDITKGDT